MKYILVPYKFGSKSASQLMAADPSFVRASRKKRLDRIYRPGDVLINWGCTNLNFPYPEDATLVNDPFGVYAACNKLITFRVLTASGVPTPIFTTDINVAYRWNKSFIARGTLIGTGGKDAVFYHTDNLPPADEIEGEFKLYSQYIPKSHEYRIHVFNGKVISLQQKRKKNGANADPQICNHDRGWVFCREKVDPPKPETVNIAIHAVRSLQLDFGAADVVYNKVTDESFVLEVNTAPGLQGSTVHEYVRAFKKRYK